MRYLRFIARSPRLIAQLLLLTALAGLVGGTGLAGLFATRGAVTDITSQRVPAVVHLLNVQRDIAEANYAGLTAIFDPNTRRTAQVDLPRILSLSAEAATEYQRFAGMRDQSPGVVPLKASVSRLLARWRGVATQTKQVAAASPPISPTVVLAAYANADSTIVNPLSTDLNQLVRVEIQGMDQARASAVSSTQRATLLLWGVIIVTLVLVSGFQVAMSAREYWRTALAQQTGDLIGLLDRQGKVLFVSPSYERLLGYKPAKLVGRIGLDLIHPGDRALAATALVDRIQDAENSREHEVRFLHADGSYRWLALSGVNKLHDPLVGGIIVTSRDITGRKETEAALEFHASHDALTTLPNRFLLQESIEHALAAAGGGESSVSLLLFDLNHFKEVNADLGLAAGDTLLLEVARRLAIEAGPDDFMARAHGDEFAILSRKASEESARGLADRILKAFDTPCDVSGQAIMVDASIGLALFPAHADSPQALLLHAEAAIYEAKRKQQRIQVYTAAIEGNSSRRLALSRDLHQAIQNGQLTLHYQPKVDPVRNRLVGVEALVRWTHPVLGFIPPDQFIPLAEQNGLVEPLTVWVLDTAARQCKTWREGGRAISVAVNLSARTLQNHQFPNEIAGLLERHGLAAESLTLEITESSIMSDPAHALDVLSRLRGLGVRLSIDDFGTGYSSLGYLKELPVHEVKIDKSFVLGLGRAADTKNAAIVRSIIALGHALRLRVVAEGVEDEDTKETLADLKCDTIQGYHISRPLSSADFETWLRSTGIDISTRAESVVTQPLSAPA